VATLYPDLVLRHVMPVFTFMGASTIRHDDNYTFTVMQKSLRAILPSMVKQGGIGVSDVLRIFVDNFQHVPLHRRLHLFASVLQTLSLKYLPDLLLLFLVKHITQVPRPPQYLRLQARTRSPFHSRCCTDRGRRSRPRRSWTSRSRSTKAISSILR
jgi:hypothetical protein